MSVERQHYEALRWLKTAEEDINAAGVLKSAGLFSHSCFMAQQSAEKAVKALWYRLDADPWGHSIQKLLQDAPHENQAVFSAELLAMATVLDRFYIPARYPNGLPDLTPGTTFTVQDAEMACRYAAEILKEMKADVVK